MTSVMVHDRYNRSKSTDSI